jgi:methylase of polypeptide subunit release factors
MSGARARRAPWLRLGDPLFRSRHATLGLFGIDPGPLDHDAFDLASLALRRGIRAWISPGSTVLEVGTGPCAVLAVAAARRGARVVALEAHEGSCLAARERLAGNHWAHGVELCHERFGPSSPLRSAELVLANPPYVPRDRGERIGLDPGRGHAWCGGEDGLDGYRALGDALRGRFDGPLLLGGSSLFHRPARVAALLRREVRGQRRWGPGWALLLGRSA